MAVNSLEAINPHNKIEKTILGPKRSFPNIENLEGIIVTC